MKFTLLVSLLTGIMLSSSYAGPIASNQPNNTNLLPLPGFFRFSFDNNIKMPNQIPSMGLLGLNYFADITPTIYAGLGGYGSIIGTQGGLFTVGAAIGLHHELFRHWWGDVGFFVGGGGGRASLVGGGLMTRSYIGVAYAWSSVRLGLHYSDVNFPSGDIRSQQFGLDLDLPFDIYYISPFDSHVGCLLCRLDAIRLPLRKFLGLQRNDFAILLQEYYQRPGTKNNGGEIQDGMISLVGAEFDHYLTDHLFWWFKTSGAYAGIPNGYMDVLGGIGYHFPLGSSPLALVPQFGIGAGGGGAVETGGGFVINPLLGVELAMTPKLSLRISSGYLWSPKGEMNVIPLTGELLYHLDIATGNAKPTNLLANCLRVLGWRIQLFSQTYFHPQRSFTTTTSAINLIGIQIDQLLTPLFFLSYQAAGAYSGFHAGGYATGMIGPGIQSAQFFNQRLQFFSEMLIGTGGGGGLAISGGSLIEPLAGVRFAFTKTLGLQASIGQLKSLRDNLNTPVLNIGFTVRFDILDRM